MVKDGKLHLNMEDEIVRSTLVTEGGEIVNPRVREVLLAAGTGGAVIGNVRRPEPPRNAEEPKCHQISFLISTSSSSPGLWGLE